MKVCSVCERCYEDDVFSCSEAEHDRLLEWRAGDCEPVAGYHLQFLHERDAAGDTFRAVSTTLDKPFLIKIIAPGKFDAAAHREFLREAQAVSAIIHPHLARVFESGTLEDGSLYVVTEYFAAQTLSESVENVGKPTETTAVSFARQAAEGLEAIHAAGALHRHVRPENLLLTAGADNRVLVKLQNLDFGGIAQKQAVAHAELYLDSFRYFSPEQCGARETNAQTDVYSLAVVLYELLAGHVPFDAPYADALIAKQINEPAPPVKINSFDIRMLLTHTLSDALQKTTLVRLKSANALARQLRHIEQLATHSSTPPPAVAYPANIKKAEIVPPAAPVIKKAEIAPPVIKEQKIVLPPPVVEEKETVLPIEPKIAETEIPVAAVAPAIENHAPAAPLPTLIEPAPPENFVEAAPPLPEIKAEEIAPAAPVFVDLTTTKLPPVESIIAAKPPANEYQTQELSPSNEIFRQAQAFQAQEPAAERKPKVIPAVVLIADENQPKPADVAILDEEILDEPAKLEPINRRRYDDEPVFSSYNPGKSWSLPDKRKLATGAVVAGLLIIAVFGTFLNRQIQSARSNERTDAKTPTKETSVTKPAEPVKASENVPPAAKTEALPASNRETLAPTQSDSTETPNYIPRQSEEKNAAPAAQPRVKQRAVKNPSPEKTTSVEVFDKKGNPRPLPDKKSEDKKQTSSGKSDALTRPRVVKNK